MLMFIVAILLWLFAVALCLLFLGIVSAAIGAIVAIPIFFVVVGVLGWGLTYLQVWACTSVVTFIWFLFNTKIEGK